MTNFKLRAECVRDAVKAILNIPMVSIKMEQVRFPDVELEFTSNLSFEDIKDRLDKIIDGHVMAESLDYIDKYTGKRNFR